MKKNNRKLIKAIAITISICLCWQQVSLAFWARIKNRHKKPEYVESSSYSIEGMQNARNFANAELNRMKVLEGFRGSTLAPSSATPDVQEAALNMTLPEVLHNPSQENILQEKILIDVVDPPAMEEDVEIREETVIEKGKQV